MRGQNPGQGMNAEDMHPNDRQMERMRQEHLRAMKSGQHPPAQMPGPQQRAK